ncbi:MAG: FxLYD domain-containing protein [Nitrososphaeraceae archaeon]|jgi:hypothetical protein
MKKVTNEKSAYLIALAAFLLCSIGISSISEISGSSNITTLLTSDISNTTNAPSGDVINSKYLEITNHTFSEDLLSTIVNGTLVNNSNNTINSAEVTVQYFDDNDKLITSSTENAKFIILAPGENSSFSVRSDLGEEIVSKYIVIPGGDIEVG